MLDVASGTNAASCAALGSSDVVLRKLDVGWWTISSSSDEMSELRVEIDSAENEKSFFP